MRSRFVRGLFVLVVLVLAPASRAQDLVGLYLTWSEDPTTTMTINWVDLYPKGTNTVWYRQVGGDLWTWEEATPTVIEPSSLVRHSLQLRGLKPGAEYEFGIGKIRAQSSSGAWDGWTFRTMPAEMTKPVRFITGGDMMHSRKMLDAMSTHVKKLDPDFVLFGGDLAYENGATATRIVDWLQSWKEHGMTKERRLIPVIAVIGNHEVRGGYNGNIPSDAPYYYGLFTLPGNKAYFALDFGKYLSIVAMDSGHTNKIPGAQTQWLAQALEQRAGQTFLFPCYHFPAYGTTKAPKGKTPIDSARAVEIRKNWAPLFDQYGISAAFENDHHNYKRTHPIRGDRRDDENGIVYLGDGAWGVETREVPEEGTAWWLAKAEGRNHFWIVDLKPDQTFTARAMDPKGEVFDEATFKSARTKATR